MKYTINEEQAGLRLDIFMTQVFSDLTRSQLQKLIKRGAVTINDKIGKSNSKLLVADEVTVDMTLEEKIIEVQRQDRGIFDKIEVIAETPEYLIINKPAGLIVHGAKHLTELSLADWLLEKYPEIKEVGDDPLRPGIVHRLDKDVSGIMVVARTQEFFTHIKKRFASRQVKKHYTALVFESIKRDEGVIEFVIERAASGHRMAARPVSQEGKPSISLFKVIKRYINYTLLDVEIKTGRTHQIRAHLGAYGHPLVGDNLYGTTYTKRQNQKINTDRIYLNATLLSFKDLQGVEQTYSIPLPAEFENLLKNIK